MGKLSKIFSALSFVCLALLLSLVGVWALADLNFAVGGDITYTAPTQDNGYDVTINNFVGIHGPTSFDLYINDEKTNSLWLAASSWSSLSFSDVKNVKVTIINNLEGEIVILVDQNNNEYSTTYGTISIDIKGDTILTFIEK